jgi:hypothetical protein
VIRHTTNRAKMPHANLTLKVTRKTGIASRRIGRFRTDSGPDFCTSLSSVIDEKFFENLPRVFLRKKPGANTKNQTNQIK